ncbi:hypothetical protein QSJ19_18645 [Gordonia sp. ABSL11-1]|uniref:hypothetical protein n=1 Tax=Gordonia sp. ABSL11-1 TaxID=3053924 RepID=UPI002573F270|nr:hypothetical protein [Gordonia sp. ABSL11-1]MDL9947565.1 hypothetical protein [Gordonia sp. ABSL11-1]
MPPTTVKSPTIASGPVAVLGAIVGGVVGLLAPLPLALFLRHWLGLPEIDPTPAPKALTATYWLPWTLSWIAANLPGVILILWPPTRRVGRWYLIASISISTLIVWFYFGFEYKGFSPD